MDKSRTFAATPPAGARQPTLRQLRGFHAVARHSSFTQAADELALTQPALSATIRDLEALLDVALFERRPHHVSLTAAGRALLPHVEWLLNSYSHGVAQLHHTLAQQTPRLRVAALPSVMHLLAPPLAEWRRRHPEVALTLRDPLNDDLVTAVHTGEVDLALGAELDLPPNIDTQPVTTDELVALLPRQHRLAERTGLRWRDLQGERLALFARGATYDLALTTLRQQGVPPDGAERMLYSESLLSLVRSGLAVGVISRLYTQGQQARGLRVRPLSAPTIARRIVLMTRAPAELRAPVVTDCLKYLAAALSTRATAR